MYSGSFQSSQSEDTDPLLSPALMFAGGAYPPLTAPIRSFSAY
jgi:hypothetical protein